MQGLNPEVNLNVHFYLVRESVENRIKLVDESVIHLREMCHDRDYVEIFMVDVWVQKLEASYDELRQKLSGHFLVLFLFLLLKF